MERVLVPTEIDEHNTQHYRMIEWNVEDRFTVYIEYPDVVIRGKHVEILPGVPFIRREPIYRVER